MDAAQRDPNSPAEPGIARIASGIQGVDLILGGGFMTGSVQLLLGRPGSGKTIFANQFAFHLASAGHKAAYVTLLAESHARMLSHLAAFSFFDPELVSRRILYMSGYGVLEQSGLDGLLDVVTRTIRDQGSSLLVIDGLTTAKEFSSTTTSFKRFLLRLSTAASLTSCTTLLIAANSRASSAIPENSTVDGIVVLQKRQDGPQVIREFVVEKMRATRYALGRHAFDIDKAGLHVWPRLESLPVPNAPDYLEEKPLRFGIRGLDALIGGGVLRGSSTAIVGATGAGKTLLGLQFLHEGVRQNQPGVYLGLREPMSHVMHQAKRVGLDLEPGCRSGGLTLMWFPPTERRLDALAWQLFDIVKEGAKQRVFIDGMEWFLPMLVYPGRLQRFYSSLLAKLTELEATTFLAEINSKEEHKSELLLKMSPNNVLALREETRGRQTVKTIVALKVQGSQHDLSPRRIYISERGLFVEGNWWDRISKVGR
jgi:circadian clock protein KaiC